MQSICSATDSSGYTASTIFTTLNSSTEIPSASLVGNSFDIYPNPVAQNALITYQLNASENVSISIYNVVGQNIQQVVKNELQSPGTHSCNATISIPGVYFIKLTAGRLSVTKKIVKL